MPGPELSAVQRCCPGPRAHVLSLNTEAGERREPVKVPGPRRQSAREGSSAAECPRWTRQGARSDFGICLIFFQTYFISSASESSVPIRRRKEKRWRHTQGQEGDSWGSRRRHA